MAVNDTATLASAPGSVSGNVTGNDTVGADQPGYVVKEVSFGGTITAVPTVWNSDHCWGAWQSDHRTGWVLHLYRIFGGRRCVQL
jgi:hypothetical protein